MNNEDAKVVARALAIMSLTLLVNIVFIHLVIFDSSRRETEADYAMGNELYYTDLLYEG